MVRYWDSTQVVVSVAKLLEFKKFGQCFEEYSLNFGGLMGRLELDLVVLVGLFQLGVFCNSVC